MRLEQIFTDLLERPTPAALDLVGPLLRLDALARPDDRDVMPLVTPLARAGDGVLGLLHWPTPEPTTPVPVVHAQGTRLRLVSPSVRGWVRHRLAAHDQAGTLPDALAVQASEVYALGEVAVSGLPLQVWTILKGEGSPAAYQAMMERHLARGDATAALVAAERAADRFAGWAEPHAWRHRIHHELGDPIQARDAATAALGLPVWTLTQPLEPLAQAIGWTPPFDGSTYGRLASDPSRAPADRAAHRLDQIAVDGDPWGPAREGLGEAYTQAGLETVARLVATAVTPEW